MCELYGMSSSKSANIFISLCEFRRHGGDTSDHVDGWGIAYVHEHQADIYKEAEPAALSLKMDDVIQHHSPSDIVISHIRKATQGAVNIHNTQPFSMDLGGRTHVFVHNGNLINAQKHLHLDWYQPDGETDSEIAFGHLIEKLKPLWDNGEPEIEDRITCIESEFTLFESIGIANFIYTDGDYLYAYADERIQVDGTVAPPGLWYLCRQWNNDQTDNRIAGIKMTGESHQQLLVASVPLTSEQWQPMARKQLIVAKDGYPLMV